MVLAVPKAFILNNLLDSKLSDSLFIINSFIIMLFLSMSKNTQKCPKYYFKRSFNALRSTFSLLLRGNDGSYMIREGIM